ncbi:FhaC Hemolysin activation/secretion protein [Burkholderiaceae bacterium]
MSNRLLQPCLFTLLSRLSPVLRWLSAAALVCAAGVSTAQAQTPPNAGSILRQTEQELQRQTPPAMRQRREAPPAPMLKLGEATVTVNSFQFDGNTLVSTAQLSEAVAPYLARPLGFAQLQQAADAVANTYREAGWIVRAFLPKQDISNGVVTVHIIEAVFGQASVISAEPPRVDAARLIGLINTQQAKGQPLSAVNLDRALLLLDDLPGVSVAGNLVQGQEHGETDVGLTVTNEPWLTGSAASDNSGSLSTGQERLSANFALNSPLGLGDLFTLNLLKTQGSDYQRLAYSLPVGYDGARAGVHASHLNYNVVGTNAYMGLQGQADNAGLDASFPVVRSQVQNLSLTGSADVKRFSNTALAAPTSRYRIHVVNLGLSGTQFDTWGGGGANAASVNVLQGSLHPDNAEPVPSQNNALLTGRYSKLNLNLSRQQAINTDLSVFMAASWQAASKNLDPSEKLYFGGAGGVRAYPSNEAGGSEGRTLTTELRQRLGDRLTLTGFHDYGWVKLNRNPVSAAPAVGNYNLQGYGLSLAWQGPSGIDLKGTVAKRMGTNPAANAAGLDSDGTLKTHRVWLNALVSF